MELILAADGNVDVVLVAESRAYLRAASRPSHKLKGSTNDDHQLPNFMNASTYGSTLVAQSMGGVSVVLMKDCRKALHCVYLPDESALETRSILAMSGMDVLSLLDQAAKSDVSVCQHEQYLLFQVSVQFVQARFLNYVLSALVDRLDKETEGDMISLRLMGMLLLQLRYCSSCC